MTTLRRRTQLMRHRCEPHPNVISFPDRHQGFGGAGGNTRRVVTEIAWNLIRKNYGRSVLLMEDDRAVWAGLYAVAAFRAPLEKQRLVDRARRTQPIRAKRRGRFFRRLVAMDGKFTSGFGNR